jgi:hypothetical protein
MLGDAFFHWGRFHAIDAWEERAEAALQRALELDSAFAAPLVHLVEIAAMRGDTSEVRARRNLYLARRFHGRAGRVRTLAKCRRSRRNSAIQLAACAARAPADRVAGSDADGRPHRRRRASMMLPTSSAHWPPGSRGPAKASCTRDLMGTADRVHARSRTSGRGRAFVERQPPQQAARAHVLNALYWDGDPVRRRAPRGSCERQARQELSNRDPAREGSNGLCIWEQWRLAHGDASTASRAIARLNATAIPATACAR